MTSLGIDRVPSWFATCVSGKSIEVVLAWLDETDFRTYRMDWSSIRDERSLFEAVLGAVGRKKEGSGLEPLGPNLNWDGVADYLYQELTTRPDERIAILWSGTDQMLGSRLQLFLNALEWLGTFAYQLSRTDENKTWSLTLRVLLLGDGPAFLAAVRTK